MKKLRTREEANKINWERSDREHNEIFPKMLTDLKSLKLKRIDVVTGDRNNHKSDLLKKGTFYLVGYSGQWTISKALRMRDGDWEVQTRSYSIGIGMVDFLFEIKSLSEYESEPLGRVESSYDEFGDLIDDEDFYEDDEEFYEDDEE